jgi:NAD-dependent SIR2 family protein deacetylase
MTSKSSERETAVCSQCGQAVETPKGGRSAADSVVLCDRCYLCALAPDHRTYGMELLD